MHPILFRIGGLAVRSYWVLAAVSVVVTAMLVVPRGRTMGLSGRRIGILIVVTLLSVIAGARAGYLLVYANYYRHHPNEILQLQEGGFAVFGGLAAVWASASMLLHRWRMPVRAVVDRMIPPMVIGQAVVKVGCFLQGCCYGYFTHLPWGITDPGEARPRHPTQLYEMAALLGIFAVMMWTERRGRGKMPPHLLTYGLLYGMFRLGTDFLRVAPAILWKWNASQLIALPLAAVCGLLLLRRWIACTRSS